MSALRAEAIQMLNQFPEEKVPQLIRYMKSLRLQIADENDLEHKESIEAFNYLKSLKISVPDDLDETKELMEALCGKYGSAD